MIVQAFVFVLALMGAACGSNGRDENMSAEQAPISSFSSKFNAVSSTGSFFSNAMRFDVVSGNVTIDQTFFTPGVNPNHLVAQASPSVRTSLVQDLQQLSFDGLADSYGINLSATDGFGMGMTFDAGGKTKGVSIGEGYESAAPPALVDLVKLCLSGKFFE